MKVVELFGGTRSISNVFDRRGHKTYSIEINRELEGNQLYKDILDVSSEEIINNFGKPDVVWASPPCTTFSIAGIGSHRRKSFGTGELIAKSELAKNDDKVLAKTIQLIKELQPKVYFIENPVGGMRKCLCLKEFPRYTVTYCQYGDKRMKPTDIWTNHPNPNFKPMCHKGDPCHESAPRHSCSGTQALKNAKERAIIPEQLCEHIVDICEEII